ncbi:hypothetical protein PF010_g8230 [Phytophthora fragariae]|uniref:Uncharacterized protein n=1 Tax=Phytophthora fragariae TaxID=53985 RepID=A0A6A3SHQ9_9STRA|nr:hypothetical protein PF009_g9833 [Phytophthora fragariae]KAE9117170.1 hypothetical protein PF007_g9392 [Phytophthora fragariae]KAE9118423.1 hypothetical protein PF010_g8230 [Phytophthora fragariae]KAE9147172.1 hypothetical protein PF006_g8133 [Phytophthora fragariae]
MSALKPTKNTVSSAKEFKTLCITASKTYKIRVSNEAIRHLRLTMNTTVASASLLPEAIQVIIAALAETKKRRVGLEDVREWLAPPAPVDDEDSSEDEWSADDNLKGDPVHYIRKIVNWKREKKITYYLVDCVKTKFGKLETYVFILLMPSNGLMRSVVGKRRGELLSPQRPSSRGLLSAGGAPLPDSVY